MKYLFYFLGNLILCFSYGVYTFYNVVNINDVGLGLKFWIFGGAHILAIFIICPIILPRGQKLEGMLVNVGCVMVILFAGTRVGFGYITQYLFE